MSERIWRLKVLWIFLRSAYEEWQTIIQDQTPDDYLCCSGGSGAHDICGCQGQTLGEVYTPLLTATESELRLIQAAIWGAGIMVALMVVGLE